MNAGSARRSVLAGTAWLLLVGSGFVVLWDYQAAPGPAGAVPGRWPAASPVEREHGAPTLVLFAHPRCPCSRASLAELGWIMSRAGTRARAHVLFYAPVGAPASWESGGLHAAAAAIPGVSVRRDEGGRGAALFGAETSGQVVVYDGSGRLRFRGGITAGRGHEGRNTGAAAALAALRGAAAGSESAQVFGCALSAGAAAPGTGWTAWTR